MWPRLTVNDLRVIGHYLGTLILLMGCVMLVPLVISLILGETSATGDFLIGVGSCLLLGNLLRQLHVRPGRLSRRQALLIVGLSWLVLALVAAIPLYVSDDYTQILNAMFDTISALTTTGFSLATDFDHMAIAHQTWRIMMVLLGGQGVIVVALSLGFFGRSGGVGSVYSSEGRTDHVLPNVVQSTRFIWVISGAMVLIGTIIGTCISLGIGLDFWHALYTGFYLAVSSYDTGGITPHSSSLVYYHSWEMEAFCILFALMGIVNFGIYACFLRGHARDTLRNMEFRVTIVWFALAAVVMALVVIGDGYYTGLAAVLRRGLFMALSAGTTVGLQTIYSNQLQITFTTSAMVILMALMVIGGTSGSTAGGVKMVRLGILVRWLWASVKRILLPDSAIQRIEYHQFSDRELTSELATQTMIIFTLYLFTGVLGGMLGIAFGYEAIPSMFESMACVSNDGISTGIISMDMPNLLKVFYGLEMYAGRLEFIALLATFVQLLVPVFSRLPLLRHGEASR